VAVAGWVITLFLMMRLPPVSDIRSELSQPPVQTAKPSYGQFTYNYKGENVTVVPQADYHIWVLIVSHNDPDLWYRFDLSHDKKSINTRDICVMWGGNVKAGAYQHMTVQNTDWSCEGRFESGITYFSEDEFSNNHLITNNDEIRKRIRNLHVGDQVYIKGMLVNYSEARWDGRFRNTSMTRTDRGDGACEIIYVEDVQVLSSYNGAWAALHQLCLVAFVVMVIIRSVMFIILPTEI